MSEFRVLHEVDQRDTIGQQRQQVIRTQGIEFLGSLQLRDGLGQFTFEGISFIDGLGQKFVAIVFRQPCVAQKVIHVTAFVLELFDLGGVFGAGDASGGMALLQHTRDRRLGGPDRGIDLRIGPRQRGGQGQITIKGEWLSLQIGQRFSFRRRL